MKIQFKPSSSPLSSKSKNIKRNYGSIHVFDDFDEAGWLTTNKILWISFIILYIILGYYILYLALRNPITPLGTFHFEDEYNKMHKVDMSWYKCGTDDYGKINVLEVSPNPVNLNKNVTLFLEAEVFQNISSPLKVEVKVQEKFWFGWFKIFCIDSVGSCTYEDVCQLSPYINSSTCDLPIPDSHLPCKCPIEKGFYYANQSVIQLKDPAKHIPKWLKNGKYRARVNGFIHETTNIGCYEFMFEVTS